MENSKWWEQVESVEPSFISRNPLTFSFVSEMRTQYKLQVGSVALFISFAFYDLHFYAETLFSLPDHSDPPTTPEMMKWGKSKQGLIHCSEIYSPRSTKGPDLECLKWSTSLLFPFKNINEIWSDLVKWKGSLNRNYILKIWQKR